MSKLIESLEGRRLMSATTVVTPEFSAGWHTQTSGTTQSVTFENGPASPPLGAGSVELSVGADGNGAAQIRNSLYAGVKLSNITELSYAAYVDQDGSGGQAPYVLLNVDYDNNGTIDDFLFFEPVYQDATFFPQNPQQSIALDTWQTWDALDGGWWSAFGTAGAGPGVDVKSLDDIIAAEPDATIVGSGVRLVAGFGAGAWDNFVGNVDAVSIGVSGATTTYNFELTASKKVLMEQCKNGGWQAEGAKNQGQCISMIVSKRKDPHDFV
jgi:hypothetical protein